MACAIEKRWTRHSTRNGSEDSYNNHPGLSLIETATAGRTDGTSPLRTAGGYSPSHWPRVIMSCLLGDLPAPYSFFFVVFCLFGGRRSLRLLLGVYRTAWRTVRTGDASLYFGRFCGPDEIRRPCSPASHRSVSR